MGRRARGALLALVLVAGSVATAPSAHASPESDLVAKINAARRAHGLRALVVRGDLTAVAERHSARMAGQGRIFHNASLRNQVSGWTVIGENVGRGRTAGEIHRAFMRSSSHRAVILNAKYNQVGVGVTARGGLLYVSEVFVRRGATARTQSSAAPARSSATRASRTAAPSARPPAPAPARPPPEPVPVTVELLVRMMRADAELLADREPDGKRL